MQRAVAWILLLVGVVLGAGGAATLGHDHGAHRASVTHAKALSRAAERFAAATQANADASTNLAAAPDDPAARRAADLARASLAAADGDVQALRAAGAFDGDLDAAIASARAAIPPLPGPSDRFVGWLRAGGPAWAIGVLLIAVGAFLARRDLNARMARPAAGSGGAVDLPGTLERVLAEIDALDPEIAALPLDAPSVTVRARLDRIQDDLLTPVVEARGQLVARHGLSRFAIYFGAFSAGERNLARVWSALTDGHTPTAIEALRASRAAFAEAREAWDRVEPR